MIFDSLTQARTVSQRDAELPPTSQLIQAANELIDTHTFGAHALEHERRLAAFIALYREWIITARGLAEAAEQWAERSAILLHCLCAGTTLTESAAILSRFSQSLWGTPITVSSALDSSHVALEFDEPFRAGPGGLISDMWLPTVTLSMFEFLVDDDLAGVSLQVRHPQHLTHRIEALMFGRPIVHSASQTALLVPRKEIRRAVIGRATDIAAYQSDFMRAVLHAIQRSTTWKRRVAALLWDTVQRESGAPLEMSSIAERLGCDSTTLRRRLAQESTTFREIKLEVLNDMARGLLKDGRPSLELIADRLGYSDAFSFRRAFRRCNGISPSAYRRQHRMVD